MAAFSDYAESQLGAALLNGGTYIGGPVYVALFTSDPTDANGGTEASYTGYARLQAHTSVVSDGFTESPTGTFANTKVLEFAPVADGSITVTHAAIFDAPTGGNLLVHGAVGTPKTFDIDDIPRYAAGSIVITIS
jgi:hypothetical protein